MWRCLMVSALVIAGARGPGFAADRESAFRGKRDAEINCGACHAVGLSDRSTNPLAPPLRHLSTGTAYRTLRRDIIGPLFRRHAIMPDFELTPSQASDIMDYIDSIQVRHE